MCWLRATECFSLLRSDLTVIAPGPVAIQHGVPNGDGFVGLKLLPSTKNSQLLQVDVAMCWHSGSGLPIGFWWTQLVRCLDKLHLTSPSQSLFVDPVTRVPWTSTLYRTTLLFPLLLHFRLDDPYLAQFDDSTPEKSIAFAFNDFKLWKRSGDTHVAKKRPGCARKATETEIYWNGRWRLLTARTGLIGVDPHCRPRVSYSVPKDRWLECPAQLVTVAPSERET